MIEHTCCFSGHRSIPEKNIKAVEKRLCDELEILINLGVIYFISGGALGFDQLAAKHVLIKKRFYPHIKLIFALPCKDQDKLWTMEQAEAYSELLHQADQILYTGDNYDKHCMKVRNKFMVDNSSFLICFLKNIRSGTSQTVKLAEEKDIFVINIADL